MTGTELGIAWVTVAPSMKGFASALNSGISKDVSAAGQNAGTSFGSKMIGALGTVVKGASIGGAIFGGLALKSGLERLTTIQNATQSLTTIMGDAGKAADLMGQIKKTVQGTPFNLDQFADAGKNLAAMNISGAKIPAILTAIGDAAATSGKGAEGVSQLVDVFGKMSAQGQVSLDQIWSISASGVPALQILANGFGVTTESMKKMISDGSVPAGKAIDILTAGIENGSTGAAGATLAFAGSMEGLRKTFTGAFGGMKAAVARFGASVLGPFIPLMTNAFTGTGAFLDSIAKRVTPVMERAANAIGSLISGLTGAKFAGTGAPLDAWVAKGEAVRAMLVRIKDGAVGLYQLLVNGDFTHAFASAFGVQEDSPVVDYILNVRDAISGFITQIKGIDTSSVSTALSGTGAAFASIGGVFGAIKDNAATLKPAIADLGSAMASIAGGGGTILANLMGILAGTLKFFADHTTLATGVILALTAAMVASGPISKAYQVSQIIKLPVIVAQTIAMHFQTAATVALTAALVELTAVEGAEQGVAKRGLVVRAAQATWNGIVAASTAAASAAQVAWNTVQNEGIIGAARLGIVLVAQKVAMVAGAVASGVATGAMWLFNAAMDANPITLIIIGIAALVAGLVLFFTKTELGRKIITAVWSGIKTAVGAVVGWFVNTAWPLLQKVWDGIATGVTWLWSNVLQPVFGFIWDAFKVIGTVVMAVWNGFLSPVFQLIGAIVQWLWNNVLSVVFAAIQVGWQALGVGFSAIWNGVLKPVFTGIGDAASWLWDNVLSPVFGWIGDKWSLLLLGMEVLWNTVLQPAFQAVGDVLSSLWSGTVSPVLGWIGDAWSGLMTGIKAVWDTVLSPVFDAIKSAVGSVQTAFENVVSGVKTAWDKLLDIAKVPVKFVVNDVINGVFIIGFNKLAKIFETTPIDPIQLPAGFAAGGPVRGPGTGTSDSIPAMLSNGEHVTKERQARKFPNLLTAVNNGTFDGPDLPRYYADGGFVQPMMNAVHKQFPQAILNSGYRPGANDYHGKGQATDLGWGPTPVGGDGNQGLASMNAWIYDTYGKKSAELIYDGIYDSRMDIKNGANHTYDPATSAQHHNHVHWALDSLDVLGGASGPASGGGGIVSSVLDFLGGLNPFTWLKGKIDGVMGGLGNSGFAKMIGGAPGHLLKLATDKFSALFGSGATASSGVGLDAWIVQAIQKTGVNAGWIAGLRTLINRESGGNPRAQNNSDSNAAKGTPSKGLMQLIGPTFEAYRDKTLVDDIFDPLANITAGIRYILAKYGGIEKVQQANPNMPAKGYDNGGWLAPGKTVVENRTGKPEAVFNPSQWATLNAAVDAPTQSGEQPDLTVHVYVGDREITDIVRVEMQAEQREQAVQARVMGMRI